MSVSSSTSRTGLARRPGIRLLVPLLVWAAGAWAGQVAAQQALPALPEGNHGPVEHGL